MWNEPYMRTPTSRSSMMQRDSMTRARTVENAVTVMDGGMGHMLRRLGVPVEGEVGSMERFLGVATANIKTPDIVRQAHSAFISAGARIIITNNYACVPGCLEQSGTTSNRSQLREFIVAAGQCAVDARKQSNVRGVQIAGCLPPLTASYRADLVGEQEQLLQDYTFVADALSPFCDVLLCETMSLVREGVAAATAASAFGKPVWIAWTMSEAADGTLRSGESIEEAVWACSQIPNVQAMLLNCCCTASITAGLPRLRAALPPHVIAGGYANGFHLISGQQTDSYQKDLTPDAYSDIAKGWAEAGAGIIGGCCGVFPEHVEKLHSTFQVAKL